MPAELVSVAFDCLPRLAPSADEPVTVNQRRVPPDVAVPPHRHPWGQLAYPVSGAMRISAAGIAWKAGIPLGVVPAGTMNLFARSLKLPLDINLVLDTLAAGKVEGAFLFLDEMKQSFARHATVRAEILQQLQDRLGVGAAAEEQRVAERELPAETAKDLRIWLDRTVK